MADIHHNIEAEIPRLRRYARALTRDVVSADDLVQDCLTRALGKLHLWQQGSDLRAWLFTILHNQYVNHIRRAVREGAAVTLNETGPMLSRAPQQGKRLELRDLERAIAQLPEEQRSVVLLVGLEGMRYEEVAAVLDAGRDDPLAIVARQGSLAKATGAMADDEAEAARSESSLRAAPGIRTDPLCVRKSRSTMQVCGDGRPTASRRGRYGWFSVVLESLAPDETIYLHELEPFSGERVSALGEAPDTRLIFPVRLGKVSLSRVCHPQPHRCRLTSTPVFLLGQFAHSGRGNTPGRLVVRRSIRRNREEIDNVGTPRLPGSSDRAGLDGDKGRRRSPTERISGPRGGNSRGRSAGGIRPARQSDRDNGDGTIAEEWLFGSDPVEELGA